MKVYINGIGAVSPQQVWNKDAPLLSRPCDYAGDRLPCQEPDYAQYIEPKHLRRMSRILKMGVTASAMALQEAGVKIPDGIITGTGYGCLEDTEIFLRKMIELREEALNPTPFIQSTHNTIGSQIALLLMCQGYNQTYTQEGFSFESALLDTLMGLKENPNQIFLTGGVDETTSVSHQIQGRFGIFRKSSISSLNLFNSSVKGALHGEGAFYFALSGKKGEETYASIDSITTFYSPDREELVTGIDRCIRSASLTPEELDLVLIGKCGDTDLDSLTEDISKQSFGSAPVGLFKHLSGEYSTASAFALWLGTRIIQTQQIPPIVLNKSIRPLRNILIYNPYFRQYHSLILLRAC
jgi:3-oxoacyl-[acyl-carrier-protein] synthase II